MADLSTRTSAREITPRIAPSLPVSDKAAHVEPSWLSPAGRTSHLSLAADSDPIMDEALKRVRERAATGFSSAGIEALHRTDAAVQRIEREREQQRLAEIDAAWAEYNDQPAVEVKQYLSAAA